MTTHLLPAPQTPILPQGGVPPAADTLSRAPRTEILQGPVLAPVRSLRPGGCGPAEEQPPPAAEEHFSPAEAGRHQELSPPAVRAVPRVAASPPAWSSAFPPEQTCPHPVDMSHPLLREDRLPSDRFLLCVPFHLAAIGHHKAEPLPHRLGCSAGPLDFCPGRVRIYRVVMSNRTKVVQQEKGPLCQRPACFHLRSVFLLVRVIPASSLQTTSSATFPCTPSKPRSPI